MTSNQLQIPAGHCKLLHHHDVHGEILISFLCSYTYLKIQMKVMQETVEFDYFPKAEESLQEIFTIVSTAFKQVAQQEAVCSLHKHKVAERAIN